MKRPSVPSSGSAPGEADGEGVGDAAGVGAGRGSGGRLVPGGTAVGSTSPASEFGLAGVSAISAMAPLATTPETTAAASTTEPIRLALLMARHVSRTDGMTQTLAHPSRRGHART